MTKVHVRLDQLLIDRGITAGRGEAQELIRTGKVRSAGLALTKPGQAVEPGIELVVEKPAVSYASRGGIKLAAALETFAVPVAGSVALDVGASTGGFTDVLLRYGAARVYAVDVGYGQIAWALRNDPRVVVMDRTNIRNLDQLPDQPSLATIDVAFISLNLVLPAVQRLLSSTGQAVCLVKPQFEVGRGQVGKGGVVRDPRAHAEVLRRVLGNAVQLGWAIRGLIASPISGPAGNREFLAWLDRAADAPSIDLEHEITGVSLG